MALEVELEVLKSVVNKLDSSLEKISEVSNSIAKLLAVHDERLDSIEKHGDKKEEEIKDLHSRITTQTREIVEKLENMEKRIEDRIKQNTDNSTSQHLSMQAKVETEMKKIDGRLKELEKWRWYILGVAAGLALVFSNSSVIKNLLH